MTTFRLEAFSDAVIAIIITIMVLELNPPDEYSIDALIEILPTFASYIVSYLYVSVYWVSHHQLFAIVDKVDGKILWTNLHFLFWLSMIPFTTAWIGEGTHHSDIIPIISYGIILIICHLTFIQLRKCGAKLYEKSPQVGEHLKTTKVEIICLSVKFMALLLTFINPYISIAIFLLVGFAKAMEIYFISQNLNLDSLKKQIKE